jgi:glycosyltransferase involved in cell wall biosynthesis
VLCGNDESLVTVIVPAWNAASTLGATLRSAARQTHRNLEILIVDDGSTDETAEIARRFCEIEPRARLIKKENGGPASARNAGIEEARGDWIAPLDSDDLWHPEKIERQLRTFASASPKVGLVYCWYRSIDTHDRIVGMSWTPVFEGPVFDRHLECNFVGTGSTPLIRRAALGSLRYRTEILPGAEDLLLQLEIAKRYEFACTRAFLVGYRVGARGVSSHRERMTKSLDQAYRMILQDDPKFQRQVLLSEHARSRATSGLVALRHGRVGTGLSDLANAFSAAPRTAASEVLTHVIRRVQRAIADPGPRELFLSVSPDHAA